MAMSTGDIRRVSRQDIQLVQNLIERCLQLYMNQKEVVQTLLTQAKIEPGFTELVWQKLEEQNREFFKAYHIRLMLKNQIILFNQLLERQVQLMRETKPTGISQTLQNGSSLSQTPFQYVSTSRADYTNGSVHPSNIINGGPLMHQGFQIATNVASFNSVRADIPTSAVSTEGPTMQMTLVNGRKGISMKLEPNYLGNSEFPFCTDGTFLSEQQPQMDDANAASLSGGELSPDHINEPLVDNEPFGFLSQIPRNVSFSDLADHFSLDVLEGFGKSPFCVSEPNNFSGSPHSECEGENKRFDTIAESATYN